MSLDWITVRLRTVVDFLEVNLQADLIPGYLHEVQGYALMILAESGPGVGGIVEIGSFFGKSTCWLAAGTKKAQREKVTAVDHFKGSPEHQAGQACASPLLEREGTTYNAFLENIRKFGVEDWVVPMRMSSEEAAAQWSGPIRLLFIDGDHSYEASKKDFETWAPFVVHGGVIAFHDIYEWTGVTQFYNELMANTKEYKQIMSVMGLNVIQRA